MVMMMMAVVEATGDPLQTLPAIVISLSLLLIPPSCPFSFCSCRMTHNRNVLVVLEALPSPTLLAASAISSSAGDGGRCGNGGGHDSALAEASVLLLKRRPGYLAASKPQLENPVRREVSGCVTTDVDGTGA